jgi:hypothetical protein
VCTLQELRLYVVNLSDRTLGCLHTYAWHQTVVTELEYTGKHMSMPVPVVHGFCMLFISDNFIMGVWATWKAMHGHMSVCDALLSSGLVSVYTLIIILVVSLRRRQGVMKVHMKVPVLIY